MRKMALSDLNLTLPVQFPPPPPQAVGECPTPLAQVMVKCPGFTQGRMWKFQFDRRLDCKIIHMEVHLGYLGIVDGSSS